MPTKLQLQFFQRRQPGGLYIRFPDARVPADAALPEPGAGEGADHEDQLFLYFEDWLKRVADTPAAEPG